MEDGPAVLIVDRNQHNVDLLCQLIEQIGYRALSATDLKMFDRILDADHPIALVLIDLAGFTSDVWGRCERLRAREIPFLVISPKQSAAIQRESLVYGARGVLIKPLMMKELVALIKSLVGDASRG